MAEALNWLSRTGESMWSWLVQANLWGAGVLVGCILADRLLARRVGAGWRAALYCAVLVRVAMPADWTSPLGVMSIRHASPVARLVEDTVPSPMPSAGDVITAPGQARLRPVGIAGARASAWWLVPTAHGFGVAALAAAWSARRMAMRRIVLESAAAPASIALRAGGLPVVVHAYAGPMLAGVVRPVVVLPRGMVDTLGEVELSNVLRHEACHAGRGDHLTSALVQWLGIVLWPIAAAWVAGARVRGLLEQACDERAAGSGDQRLGYAETLMRVAATVSFRRSAGALHFGQGLRARIGALRHTRRWRTGLQAGLVIVAAGAIVACAGARQERADTQTEPQGSMAPVVDRPAPRLVPPAGGSAEDQSRGAAGEKGRHDVTVTLLRSWPDDPKLQWDVRQRGGVPILSDIPIVGTFFQPDADHTLEPAEWQRVLRGAGEKPNAVVARPRLGLILGLHAYVRMGNDNAAGTPIDGQRFDLTITNLQTTAEAPNDWQYTFSIGFEEYGPEKEQKSYRAEGVVVPAGKTLAILVPGAIGGEPRLLCITPETMPRLTHGPVPAGTPGAADSRWLGAPETVAAPGAFPRVRWSVQVYRSTVESRRADEALADRNHEQWLEAPTGLSILPAGEKGKFINRLQSLPGVMRLAGVTIRLKDGERGEASSPSRRPGTTDEQEVVEVSNRLERGGLLVGGALRTRMLGGATHDHTEFNDLHLPLNGDTLVLYDRATVDREGLFVFLTPVIERTENDVPRQTFTP